MHLVDGTMPTPIAQDSPLYEKDQMLLSWINATLSDSVLPYIVGVTSTQRAWNLLKQRYASTAPAHVMALKRQLGPLKRGVEPMNEYIQQIKTLSDQLAACGAAVNDDDLVLITLDGLPPSYCQFCSSIRILAKSTDLSLEELHNLLICEEIAVAKDFQPEQPNALIASRPYRPPLGRGFSQRGCHQYSKRSADGLLQTAQSSTVNIPHHPYAPRHSAPSPNTRPICQICQKTGHLAIDCLHRMDYTYQGKHPPEKLTAMISSSVPNNSTWTTPRGRFCIKGSLKMVSTHFVLSQVHHKHFSAPPSLLLSGVPVSNIPHQPFNE
ncbi:hypothetical protein NE237_002385 [Protea cynaroides]|uniref:Gag protein n=1 Tax=Protea cynaroides TaxID=273540 RepID=A0A9Q0QZC0_9MAGN|nr:hypothetical protein NE237_002385 [Protea cynaroides]